MVFLSPKVRSLCLEASIPELNAIRDKYRHIIPTRDLQFIDKLIEAKAYQPPAK